MKPRWTDNFRSPIALVLFFGVAAVGLVVDLTTKWLAVEHLKDERVVHVIPRILNLTYTQNYGAVFGLGQGQKALFLAVSVGAILFLVFLFATSERAPVYQFVLGMLLAGVIGNMYDRLKFGYVRDMIHGLPGVYWPDWVVARLPQAWQPPFGRPLEVFPWIFNVADSLLCVGVAAMLVYTVVVEARRKRLAKASQAPADAPPGEPRLNASTEKA
jgi:signal peptidase II